MFKGVNDPKLPAYVKSMSEKVRHNWVATYNAAFSRAKGSAAEKEHAGTLAANGMTGRVAEALGLLPDLSGLSIETHDSVRYAGRNKTYPIATPEDVAHAARASLFPTDDNYTPAQLRARITHIASELGEEFTSSLPRSWRPDASSLSEDLWDLDVASVAAVEYSSRETPTIEKPPAHVRIVLPEEARTIWKTAYNMCANMGGSEWECESAAWSAVDDAGYAREPESVYVKVEEDLAPETITALQESFFVEAPGSDRGSVWEAVLIRAGMSLNRRHYSESTLRAATPLFEQVRAHADHGQGSRTVSSVVGWYDNVRYSESLHAITGRFHILESARWLKDMLLEIVESANPNLIGLSINASGEQRIVRENDQTYSDVTRITSVSSVDVVVEPAAGGSVVRLVADKNTEQESNMDPEKIRKALTGMSAEGRKKFVEDLGITEDEQKALLEGLPDPKPEPTPNPEPNPNPDPAPTHVQENRDPANPAPAPTPVALTEEAVTSLRTQMAALQKAATQGYISTKMAESRLPLNLKEKLRARLTSLMERRLPDNAEVDAMFQETHEMWADFEQAYGSGKVRVPNLQVQAGEAPGDQIMKAMEGMLSGQDVDKVKRFSGLKEAYSRITGRHPFDVTAFDIMAESHTNYDARVMTESVLQESLVSSNWGTILGETIHRRMINQYNLEAIDDWRKVVSNIEPVMDFKNQRRDRVGGYGNLPVVAEQATYPQLTSPTSEEVAYAVVKRGGVDDLTFEMIANDDIRAVRLIPERLGRAAAQTLFQFVFDLLKPSNTALIYDGVKLFDAAHSNIISGNPALGDTGLGQGFQQMRNQLAYGSTTEFLGTRPAFLLVPNTLEMLAWRLTNSDVTILGANFNATEPNPYKGRLTPIVIDYWTDANDWALVADPGRVPTIEMGFFNGQEDPELFVQDMPNVGSNFNADKITYKIRHIYSGTVLDWRGVAASLPA